MIRIIRGPTRISMDQLLNMTDEVWLTRINNIRTRQRLPKVRVSENVYSVALSQSGSGIVYVQMWYYGLTGRQVLYLNRYFMMGISHPQSNQPYGRNNSGCAIYNGLDNRMGMFGFTLMPGRAYLLTKGSRTGTYAPPDRNMADHILLKLRKDLPQYVEL